jgi:hypothetical protein
LNLGISDHQHHHDGNQQPHVHLNHYPVQQESVQGTDEDVLREVGRLDIPETTSISTIVTKVEVEGVSVEYIEKTNETIIKPYRVCSYFLSKITFFSTF